MGNLSGFDANKVEPNASFERLPPGEYEACIVRSEVKQTKAGDGKYLELEMQILSGSAKGRKLFDRLNCWNKNPEAEKIAWGTMSAICRAIGVMTPNDTSELHNRPLKAVVKVESKPGYEPRNVVKGYKSAKANPMGGPPPAGGELGPYANPPRVPPEDDSLPF